jgi:hypothetical protein
MDSASWVKGAGLADIPNPAFAAVAGGSSDAFVLWHPGQGGGGGKGGKNGKRGKAGKGGKGGEGGMSGRGRGSF